MDFGFMRASAPDFLHPDKTKDHVVYLYDSFSLYLLIVDEASCYKWVFFTTLKDPPLDLIAEFLTEVEGNSSRESIMLVYCNISSDCNNMLLNEHYVR
jgi:hypothetical protein